MFEHSAQDSGEASHKMRHSSFDVSRQHRNPQKINFVETLKENLYNEDNHISPEIIQEIAHDHEDHFFDELEDWGHDIHEVKSDNHEEMILKTV